MSPGTSTSTGTSTGTAGHPVTRRTSTARAGSRRHLTDALVVLAVGAGLLGVLPGAASAVTTPTLTAPPAPTLPTAVEDLQPYVGQEGCDPVAKPGVLAFQSLLMSTYRDTGTLGIVRDCGIGGQSEHKEGRAFDWAISMSNPSQVAEAQVLTDWLIAYDGPDFASNARRFGIMYMIWNHQIWKAYQPTMGWQAYTGADPHTNHVHFSFGWNGAMKATSWWSGQVAPIDYGPYDLDRPPAPVAPVLGPSAIGVKQAQLGGDGGWLGPAVGPEVAVAGGRSRPYRSGTIYWSAATGAHEVHGAVLGRYLALGGPAGLAGFPTTDETGTPDGRGRYNHFSDDASIYFSPTTGAHEVHGLIRAAWAASGWESGPAGYPMTDTLGAPDGIGRYVHFANSTSIYYSPASGAHLVSGAVRAAWAASGWEAGPAGYPTTDTLGTPDGIGRYNHFSNSTSIYTSPASGTHLVSGAVRAAWAASGWEAGPAGYPTTDTLGTPDGIGRYNHFANDTSIYTSPASGTHLVSGAVRAAWAASGWEAGPAGYPTTDTLGTPDGIGHYNHFTNDTSIYTSPTTGTHLVPGPIRAAWAASGWEAGPDGYPTTDPTTTPTGTTLGFQHAVLTCNRTTGTVTTTPR